MFPKKVTEALNILVDYFDEEKSKHGQEPTNKFVGMSVTAGIVSSD